MSNKILVTYASRTGSTIGVAEAIGKTLSEGSTPFLPCYLHIPDQNHKR